MPKTQLVKVLGGRGGEPGGGVVTGTIVSAGQRIQASLAGFNGAAIYLSGIYCAVNVSFEASYDDAASWIAIPALGVTAVARVLSTGEHSDVSQAYRVCAQGATHISVRSTAHTSGAQTVRIAPVVGAPATVECLPAPPRLREVEWQFTSLLRGSVTMAARAAAAAGLHNYVTGIQYQNIAATGAEIQVQDGFRTIWRGYAPARMSAPAVVMFQSPLRGAAATVLNVQTITNGGNTFVNLQGYQAA